MDREVSEQSDFLYHIKSQARGGRKTVVTLEELVALKDKFALMRGSAGQGKSEFSNQITSHWFKNVSKTPCQTQKDLPPPTTAAAPPLPLPNRVLPSPSLQPPPLPERVLPNVEMISIIEDVMQSPNVYENVQKLTPSVKSGLKKKLKKLIKKARKTFNKKKKTHQDDTTQTKDNQDVLLSSNDISSSIPEEEDYDEADDSAEEFDQVSEWSSLEEFAPTIKTISESHADKAYDFVFAIPCRELNMYEENENISSITDLLRCFYDIQLNDHEINWKNTLFVLG